MGHRRRKRERRYNDGKTKKRSGRVKKNYKKQTVMNTSIQKKFYIFSNINGKSKKCFDMWICGRENRGNNRINQVLKRNIVQIM